MKINSSLNIPEKLIGVFVTIAISIILPAITAYAQEQNINTNQTPANDSVNQVPTSVSPGKKRTKVKRIRVPFERDDTSRSGLSGFSGTFLNDAVGAISDPLGGATGSGVDFDPLKPEGPKPVGIFNRLP